MCSSDLTLINASYKKKDKGGVYYLLNSLFWAAEKGNFEMVKYMLDQGAFRVSAIKNVSVILVVLMLTLGLALLDRLIQNSQGKWPLFLCCLYWDVFSLCLLGEKAFCKATRCKVDRY